MVETQPAARPQFSLASLFWLFFATGLYFAYLRRYHYTTGLFGCLAPLEGLVIGAICGVIRRRFVDPTYWATLCAVFAFVSVAGEPAFSDSFRFAWVTVGALTGAVCGAIGRGRAIRRILLGGGAGGIVMWAYLLIGSGGPQSGVFDAICAPIIGGLAGLLIEIIQFAELDRRLPRYTIATWLLCAVLVGNILVPLVR